MVYRGKPSKACEDCRKRRNRCDQATPACGQCIKAKRKCPGYRNTMDLMFFDESTSVAKKSRSGATTSPDRGVFVPRPTHPAQLGDIVFYLPLDDLALNFFMATYVGRDRINPQFDYLPELYNRHAYHHSTIQETVKAVGLAGYAKATRRYEFFRSATKNYTSAIREVNNALSNNDLAVQDSTLASVLLLAMFEVIVMPKNRGLQNLTKHLNGAVSVAALQAKENSRSQFGRQLLASLCQTVIMNCWIQYLPLPDQLPTLKKHACRDANSPRYYSDFLDIIMTLIKFREALALKSYESSSEIIARAIALDRHVKTFADSIPEEGRFMSMRTTTESPLVYGRYYDVYPKNFTVHFWNNIRGARIRLNNLIVSQCHLVLTASTGNRPIDDSMTTQLEVSERAINTLAREICATVPQLAGYLDRLQPSAFDNLDHPQTVCDLGEPSASSIFNSDTELSPSSPKAREPPQAIPALPIPRPASLYHLLYVLYRLLYIEVLAPDMQAWIKERIRWIEGNAESDDLQLLHDLLDKSPHIV